VTPTRKRAWLAACEALHVYVEGTDEGADFFYTEDFRTFYNAFRRFDMYPFTEKYGYVFDESTMKEFAEGRRHHVSVNTSHMSGFRAKRTTKRGAAAAAAAQIVVDAAAMDIYDVTAAPVGASRTLGSFVGELFPNMYSSESAHALHQRILDDVLPQGFSFTYKGQRYHARPGLINICLDLTPDTDDPDVLDYLDAITPIWVIANDLPAEFDPYPKEIP